MGSRPGCKQGDLPALAAQQGASPDRGNKAGAHQRRLAAAGWSANGEHLVSLQAPHEIVDQCLAAEEELRILDLVGGQALVGAGGRVGCRLRDRPALRRRRIGRERLVDGGTPDVNIMESILRLEGHAPLEYVMPG